MWINFRGINSFDAYFCEVNPLLIPQYFSRKKKFTKPLFIYFFFFFTIEITIRKKHCKINISKCLSRIYISISSLFGKALKFAKNLSKLVRNPQS